MTHLACYRQAVQAVKSNQSIDMLAPVLKISATELLQDFNSLLLEVAGNKGAQKVFEFDDGTCIDLVTSRLLARRGSIYGGSNEIQRNIIATRILGMPKSW
jgi:alkylation response protein AidB-like acyl-CoA dehydrogenase